MKITIVAGARPNFMKIAPITRAIDAAKAQGKRISYRLVYTGVENDNSLDASLFADLHMKAPDAYLGVNGNNPTELTAGIMIAFERELTENPTHVVLVVDDHELCHRSQETKHKSSTSRSRYPFIRHVYAQRNQPYDYRWPVRLPLYSRHGSQP